MEVYVAFAKSKSWIKRLLGLAIEYIDGVPFTHAAIIVKDKLGSRIYESVIPKSRVMADNEWRKHYKLVELYVMPNVDYELFNASMSGLIGVDYSIPQLILIMIARFCNKFQKYFGNNINGSKRLICSELVAEFLIRTYGVDFGESEDFISLMDVRKKAIELQTKRFS